MGYQVGRGDSLSSIAARFQVAAMDVIRWNQHGKGDDLKPDPVREEQPLSDRHFIKKHPAKCGVFFLSAPGAIRE
jgi:LysM domain